MENQQPKIVIDLSDLAPESEGLNPEEMAAALSYFYNYTFKEAMAVPHKWQVLLLNTARREQGLYFYNQTLAAAAPHSDQGGYKEILSRFKNQAEGE